MRRLPWLWLVPFLITAAKADVVHLNNGDRLTGQVRQLTSGRLTLLTPYAGDVAINWNQVSRLSTQEEFLVEFTSGRIEVGQIFSPEPGLFQIGSSDSAEVVTAAELLSIRRPAPPAPEPGFFGHWHGDVDFGYTVARGNSDIDNLSIQFTPERKTPRDRISARFKSLHNMQEGFRSTSLYRATVRYDWFISPRTFVFGIGQFERDMQAQLNSRTSEGGGFGVSLQVGPDTQLSMFGGVTFLQENFSMIGSSLGAEGVGGFELRTSLAPLIITTSGTLFPLLSEGRYRVEWDSGIRMPLFGGFTIGVKIFDRFDSSPPREGVKRNDIGMVSTLGLQF